jgi:predicted nucleotidyltransferase
LPYSRLAAGGDRQGGGAGEVFFTKTSISSYNCKILLYRGTRMTTADVIQTMTDRIVRDFHPLRIILFGSHARSDAGPESDIDLLVVLPQVANKRLAAVAIRRALADLPVCKDIVVTTPEEITRRGDLIGTVLRPALREGKVLYERT